MKRSLVILLAASLLIAGCKAGKQSPADSNAKQEKTDSAKVEKVKEVKAEEDTTVNKNVEPSKEEMNKEPKYRIQTSKGEFVIKLYDETPLHKENFMKLAESGFFDGICFHRVINGFMVQVGDPFTKDSTKTDRWGEGGPGYTIPAEIVPGLTHKKGALAAARRGDSVNPAKESSGSQFYIVQDESGCKHLDGEYSIFGEVISGLDVIDRIASVATDFADKPIDRIDILSVTREK